MVLFPGTDPPGILREKTNKVLEKPPRRIQLRFGFRIQALLSDARASSRELSVGKGGEGDSLDGFATRLYVFRGFAARGRLCWYTTKSDLLGTGLKMNTYKHMLN